MLTTLRQARLPVMCLACFLFYTALPVSSSFTFSETPFRVVLADGATQKRFDVEPLMPKDWGGVVKVKGQLCFNFSCKEDGQNLVPLGDLPKRFHGNAKIQHRYSKRDAQMEKKNRHKSSTALDPEPPSTTAKQRRLSFIAPLLASGGFLGRPVPQARVCTPPAPLACQRGNHDSVVMKTSGGGFGFGSSGDAKGKRKGDKKSPKSKSGLSQFKDSNPGAVPEVEMVFTCNKCETRQAKRFTRLAYEEGVVIVKCSGCGAQHLIADNQGYFKDWTGTESTNVEKMLAEKGEQVDNRLANLQERPDGTLELGRPQAAGE